MNLSYCEEVERLCLITEKPTMIATIMVTEMIPCNFRFELNQNLFRVFLSIRSSSTDILVIEIALSSLLNLIVTIRYFLV